MEADAIGNELRCKLQGAMVRLTEQQATVIYYRIEGYAFSEIAELMQKTEGAVKAILHRSRETLKRLLGMEN